MLSGWAVLLLGAAVLSAGNDPPTVQEQRALDSAQATVDRAVGELVRASGGVAAGAIPAVSGYDVRDGCRLTTVWVGQELTRVVQFTTAPGTERALLDRLRTGLPAAYGATLRDDALHADAGDFVGIRAGVTGRGEVHATVVTGCRPPAALAGPPAGGPSTADGAVDAAFAALGVTEAERRTAVVSCPGGGAARTVTADSPPGGAPDPLAVPLGRAGDPLVDQPELYAYLIGDAGVVVRARADDGVTVTAATGC